MELCDCDRFTSFDDWLEISFLMSFHTKLTHTQSFLLKKCEKLLTHFSNKNKVYL